MILERVRQEIKKCGKSRNQISQDTGIDNAVLFRIYHGGGCSAQTLETLCEYLGLELTPKKRKK